MKTVPSPRATAPLQKTTFETSPTRSSPCGAIKYPPGRRTTRSGCSRSHSIAYRTYRNPAAVPRTPWAMCSHPRGVRMGGGPMPFFDSRTVWYRLGSMTVSSPMTACSMSSARAHPMPPPVPASMKESCGRV